MNPVQVVVDKDAWLATIGDLHADGFVYLDVLTAVDRMDAIELVVHLVAPTTLQRRQVTTRVPPDGHVASVTSLFPAADWHERETAEMFGLTFDGHPDPRPLLLRHRPGRPPLLKAVVLAARIVEAWPGAAEPTVTPDGRRAGNPSRRTLQPPGAPADWLERR